MIMVIMLEYLHTHTAEKASRRRRQEAVEDTKEEAEKRREGKERGEDGWEGTDRIAMKSIQPRLSLQECWLL